MEEKASYMVENRDKLHEKEKRLLEFIRRLGYLFYFVGRDNFELVILKELPDADRKALYQAKKEYEEGM